MAEVERPGKLTYERLAKSLGRLHETASAQFPDYKDAQRARDLQRVIEDALIATCAGRRGTNVVSPAQLKRDLKKRIAEIHSHHDTVHSVEAQTNIADAVTFSSSANSKTSSRSIHSSMAQKRPRPSPTREKENLTPAASFQAPAALVISAVKKTPLTKRSTNTSAKPSSTDTPSTGVKKRAARTRSRAACRVPNTPSQSSATDEVDRRAAAAALVGLAESPANSFTSLTSSTSGSNWSTGLGSESRIHGRGVFEDEKDDDAAAIARLEHSGVWEGSSPPLKRSWDSFAPVPRLEESSVEQAFEKGVHFAVTQLCSVPGRAGTVGTELEEWVRNSVERGHLATEKEGLLGARGSCGEGLGARYGGLRKDPVAGGAISAGKGFWDVV